MSTPRERLVEAYAGVLDASPSDFSRGRATVVATERRRRPYWGSWVRHVWCLAVDGAVVCSAVPRVAPALREALADPPASLLDHAARSRVRGAVGDAVPEGEWVQREVLHYPDAAPPDPDADPDHDVDHVSPDEVDAAGGVVPDAPFDGAFVVCADGRPVSYAGLKRHGDVVELATGTLPGYRRRGMVTAATARAVEAVLDRGSVPVYVPDSPGNEASYALAAAVGFERVGELLCHECKR
ncbi:MAG: GNAT family N-acetyltransferase [Halobacteriaceae archaeon]